MSEKNTKATETVEIDPGMSVMPEEPGLMDVPTVIPELDSMLAAMSSALPAYQTTAWKNKPSTETPIDAAAMTRIEQRLVDLTNAVNGLRDSVSQAVLKKTITVTTSNNGNASVELQTSGYALLGVSCPNGLDGNSGVICIPYAYSPGLGTLGFHAMGEQAPFDAVKSTELTVDVFYRKL